MSLLRFALALLMSNGFAQACTFCGGPRVTTRQKCAESDYVVAGTLSDPRPNADGHGGTTVLTVRNVFKMLKDAIAPTTLTLPVYIPVIANTPNEYFVCYVLTNGRVDCNLGKESSKAFEAFVKSVTAFSTQQVTERLAFAFKHLHDADALVSAEAYAEFGAATDAEIAAAKAHFRRDVLRAGLSNAALAERHGTYAVMLGLCGDATDAIWLRERIKGLAATDKFLPAFGGMLAGLARLDATAGWAEIGTALHDAKSPFAEKYQAYQTLRYLNALGPRAHHAAIVSAMTRLLGDAEFCDLVIEDFRRWQWWQCTQPVLEVYTRADTAPLAKRGIIRYCLACPDWRAKVFLWLLRATEPARVRQVTEMQGR
jgi:hypothetical protein